MELKQKRIETFLSFQDDIIVILPPSPNHRIHQILSFPHIFGNKARMSYMSYEREGEGEKERTAHLKKKTEKNGTETWRQIAFCPLPAQPVLLTCPTGRLISEKESWFWSTEVCLC